MYSAGGESSRSFGEVESTSLTRVSDREGIAANRQAALAAHHAEALTRLHSPLDRLAGYYGHLAKLAADCFKEVVAILGALQIGAPHSR